ncbi:MAG: nickel-dependent lactate racemase [Spirochaetales bacterium]
MEKVMVTLPCGCAEIDVTLPKKNLLGVYSPREITHTEEVELILKRCLQNPIGTRPLRDLVKGKEKVVIVADDNTRLTPTHQIIPILLNEMNAAGVPDSKISLVIALGTHRFMTDEEILQKFGKEVVNRIPIYNHPFKDPKELVDLGTTANGTHIQVNKRVYEADFKIGVGSIVPHHIPGFAGGSKIVQPGVCGEQTTADTHLLSVRAKRSYLGILENPVRVELDIIARKVGLHTIFNTVLDKTGRVVDAFFGDVVEAFRVGVKRCVEVYSVPIPQEADIVLAGSHPCDIEFWQAHKTLYPADLAVKEGGIIIVVTPCYEGVAMTHQDILEVTLLRSDEIRTLVSKGKVKDEVAAALAIAWAQVKEREKVYLVSEGIDREKASQLGFTWFATAQEALDAALAEKGRDALVTVLTHAPDMLPILPTDQTRYVVP